MGMQTVTYTINKDGKVAINIENVAGSGCESITKNVENRLGDVVSKDMKPEFYQEKLGNVHYEKTRQ
jgi:hypothetical protein